MKFRVHFQTKDKNPIRGWKTYDVDSFEQAEDLWNDEHRFDHNKQLIFTEQVSEV